ncbi:MAG: hypothetical protein ACRC3B_15845 [Bacteroidia bacterium]
MTRYLYLAFFFFAGCASDPAPKQPDKPTRVFNYYLRTAFGDSIPATPQLYLLVPQTGCKGCMVRQISTMAESLRTENNLPVQLILARKISGTDSLQSFAQQSRFDTQALMDRIDLPIAGVTLIKTEKGRVISVQPMRDK